MTGYSGGMTALSEATSIQDTATPPGRTSIVRAIDVPEWPDLPELVLELLQDIESERDDEPAGVRPWDLAHLPEEAREPVGQWLHDVARWLNRSYAWQAETVIPPCWPQHPHIALDLAVLAFGRLLTYQSATTTHPARWHDDLQAFYHRMGLALGTGAGDCRAGRHEARPAAVDIATYEHLTEQGRATRSTR